VRVAGLDIPPHVAPSRGHGRGRADRHRGFTAVELILVIVLVGIVSAVAMTRFFDRQVYDAETATEQLRSILRYGQKIAIAQNRNVFVRLAPNRIALCFADQEPCAAPNQVRAPVENSWSDATRAACGARTWMCEGRPANITGNANMTVMGFDALGQPFNVPQANQFSGLTVTIVGGDTTRTVRVDAETGYVF